MKTIIGVMGPGEEVTESDKETARQIGTAVAEYGWVILIGGRSITHIAFPHKKCSQQH